MLLVVLFLSCSLLFATSAHAQAENKVELPKLTNDSGIHLIPAFWAQFVHQKNGKWEHLALGKLAKQNRDFTLTLTIPKDDADEIWIARSLGFREKQDFSIAMYVKDLPEGQRFGLVIPGKPALAEAELPGGTMKIELDRKAGDFSCKVNGEEVAMKVTDPKARTVRFDAGFTLPPGGTATVAGFTFEFK